jgi:hypothetical protein
MKCQCGKDVVRADTDDMYYHYDETRWEVPPDDSDPGIIGPIEGAVPVIPLGGASFACDEEVEDA